MFLVLTSTPNCIPAASLWPRVCCMSAPFPCCVSSSSFCWCVFSVGCFSVWGAQHVFRLEKITNPIVCATFSTVLARFLPQRFCFCLCLCPLPLFFFLALAISFCVAPICGMLFVAVAVAVHWKKSRFNWGLTDKNLCKGALDFQS